ncbi:hypothetical protein SDC9_164671 [bioreactor metagenome]|uniref:Uncharacterized protein n=1 Tax=bioreactor metagenome TaxID=1076179 RepID=A0A645FS82_9ZZZZ
MRFSTAIISAENNIFHFGASETFCGLFTQHPTHGIRNIALAAAVGADNAGDPFF